MFVSTRHNDATRRRGVVAVFVMITIFTLLGMAALTIDVGVMFRARAELQRSADASAMAAAWELLDQDRLQGSPMMAEEIAAARQEAGRFALLNPVANSGPQLSFEDVVIGYLNDPTDPNEAISFGDPSQFNTVQVRVRRDEQTNGPIDLFFSAIFGRSTTNVAATAAATFKDGVVGFRVTEDTGNAGLLPLALHIDAWNLMINGAPPATDDWSYDLDADSVNSGSDEIHELNVFPGGGDDQLPAGNFGTIDIGSPDNATPDLERQILEGVNAEDLSYFGGELVLSADGTLDLTGDTGVSGAIKDELQAIIGLPRIIPIFNEVSGPGNNSIFTIVGFGGIRIMDVKLTGPMNKKRVIMQPAFVVDDAALTDPGSGSSYFVYQPVRLVR